MSQHPGYQAPGPHGAPQFSPPGSQPTTPIPYGYRPDPYGGPPVPPAPVPARPVAQPYAPAIRRQRPAVIAMAATMTVTASLQWLCALSLAWLVATAGAAGLSTTDAEGAFYHILRRFHLRMIEGLALPLYGFPTLAFFLGFVVLAPRVWARLALTLTGVAALVWSAWWLRNDILWWLPIATYIGIVCLILWTPGATQWYRQRAASS
ncbi:MAG TPA: hypothetical protein VM428_09535 [Microlunatus sp.]|nr:hypothetical protein [Microlunatus sp.]